MKTCESYVKEAKRYSSLFKKDLWKAALFYIQASECFLTSGNLKKAFETAKKAAELLGKLTSKMDFGVILPDLEKALMLAYRSAPSEKEKKKVSLNLYATIVQRAQLALQSGNYIEASKHFKRALEYAPSGVEAKGLIEKALAGLESLAEKKLALGREGEARRIYDIIDEFRALLPAEEEIPISLERAPLEVKLIANYTSEEEPEAAIEAFQKMLMEEGAEPIKVEEGELHTTVKGNVNKVSVEASASRTGNARGALTVSASDDRAAVSLLMRLLVKASDRIKRFLVEGIEAQGTVSKAGFSELLLKTIELVDSRHSYNLAYHAIRVIYDLARRMEGLKKCSEVEALEDLLKEFEILSSDRGTIEDVHAKRMLSALRGLERRLEEL